MSLIIPPAKRYQDQLKTLPDTWAKTPTEGPRQIPAQIKWSDMGGAGQCVSFELFGTAAPQEFSRINAISLDNSQCGCDVQFVFTDTQEIVTFPAYSPHTIVPIFTNALTFFVIALGEVLAADQTNFILHNTLPPPIAIPITTSQGVATANAIPMEGALVTEIVDSSISGTLQNGVIVGNSAGNIGGFSMEGYLEDGNGKTLGLAYWRWASAVVDQAANAIVWQASGINVRFDEGIYLRQVIDAPPNPAASTWGVTLYYRTP